jgi:hypothetical protein
MKRALLVLVFLSSGSFLAHGECQANQSLTVLRVNCACNQTMFFLNVCTNNFGGIGCDPGGQQQACGGGCTYTTAVGCNARGPKILTGSLVHQLDPLFTRTDKVEALTCSSDNGAFERWLMETSSVRRTKPI